MKANNNILFLPVLLLILWSCTTQSTTLTCAQGTVIGQGCLTGSYAIQLDRKNSSYGIPENLSYDNVVETINLPKQYQTNGTKIYFTFTAPQEETGKYLTYCTTAPQVTLMEVSHTNCPISVQEEK